MTTLQRLSDSDISSAFHKRGIIIPGHFVGTSGRHLDGYFAKDKVGIDQPFTDQLAHEMLRRLCDGFPPGEETYFTANNVVAIIGAPMGAITLAARVAFWAHELFGRKEMMKFIYAEKDLAGRVIIRPNYAKEIAGGGVICIEDVFDTGVTALSLVREAERCNAKVACCASMCNRGMVTAETLGVSRILSLFNASMPAYDLTKEPCPLCDRGIPIDTTLGHGADYVRSFGQPVAK